MNIQPSYSALSVPVPRESWHATESILVAHCDNKYGALEHALAEQ